MASMEINVPPRLAFGLTFLLMIELIRIRIGKSVLRYVFRAVGECE